MTSDSVIGSKGQVAIATAGQANWSGDPATTKHHLARSTVQRIAHPRRELLRTNHVR